MVAVLKSAVELYWRRRQYLDSMVPWSRQSRSRRFRCDLDKHTKIEHDAAAASFHFWSRHARDICARLILGLTKSACESVASDVLTQPPASSFSHTREHCVIFPLAPRFRHDDLRSNRAGSTGRHRNLSTSKSHHLDR